MSDEYTTICPYDSKEEAEASDFSACELCVVDIGCPAGKDVRILDEERRDTWHIGTFPPRI